MSRSQAFFNTFKLIAGVVTWLAIPSSTFGQAPPPGTGTLNVTGYVRVIDGDTLETRINGNLIGIGLVGVRAARANTQCGEAALALAESLLQDSGITLQEDPEISLDARNRRKYHVVTKSGVSLARELVRSGLARTTGQGRETGALRGLEDIAKRGNRGCINAFPRDKDEGKDELPREHVDYLPFRPASTVPDPESSPTQVSSYKLQNDGARPRVATATFNAAEALPRAAVPTGFSTQTIAGGFVSPTAFAVLPDGRILVAEKRGIVKIVKNGVVLPTPFLDLRSQVNAYWDHGLLGLAADPNFASNGFVYLLYTYENDPQDYSGSKTQQLMRVKAVGDVASAAPEDRTIILGKTVGASCVNLRADCIPAHSTNHAIGSLRFASDGSLFVTIGDDTTYNVVHDDAMRVQNKDVLTGKILRIDPATGAGYLTNPFYSETGDITANRSKVWAYGLRNPFRFGLRPGDDTPVVGDVGWDTWEEVNVATAGGNFGWPCYEGAARQPGYELRPACQTLYEQGTPVAVPAHEYDHTSGGASVTGGDFYTGTSYPAQFQGAYFFADYVRGWIQYLTLDSNGNAVGPPTSFATNSAGPVDIQAGPDTNLYYLAINTSQLIRIRYTATNTPPTAVASADVTTGLAPLAVQLSGSASFDPNGDTLQYSWNFGDGSATSTLPNPQHTYTANGTYNVTLTVDDGRGETHSTVIPITVGNRPPTPAIITPTPDLRFKVGDVITFSGSATDADSGQIPSAALSWRVNLHHCVGGDCHVHPFLQLAGSGGNFTVPDHADNFFLELLLTATDSGGLTATTSVELRPQTALITVNTQPSGLQVVYGGVASPSPLTRSPVVGSSATIGVVSPQTLNGIPYSFSGWSDGGEPQHSIVVGSQNATYAASFQTTAFAPIRVNAGGPAITDPQGNVWAADTGFTGGSSFGVARNISNTNTPALYRTERWMPAPNPLVYNFDVPNGTYTVTLKFAEIFFTAAARRTFHIALNGQTVEMNFDIFAQAGGADRAVDRSYVVEVTSGRITIQLTRVVENPKISAIEIVQGGAAGVNVSVAPSTVTLGPSQTQQFTATVTGSTNTAVTWSINPSVGTISTSGLYTAPSAINAQQTVTVTATSQADTTKSASATVALVPPAPVVNVSVSPPAVSRGPSQTQQFTATVTGTTNTAVTWSINPSVGTISTSGLYTAPSTINAQQTVTVTATSQADATKSAAATVTLTPAGDFTPIRVNAGGPAYTDPQGNVWAADTGFTGGNVFSVNRDIANTNTPVLYRTERWNSTPVIYNFAVPNGTYTVTLKFAEIWFTSAARRSFHIVLNGQTVEMNFDIFAEAGGADRAIDRSYVVQVNNGQIAIQLTRVIENPKISAIEIVQSAAQVDVSVSPPSVTRAPSQTQQFTASVTGTTNTAVTWSLSPNIGTISASGLYTAPAAITTQQNVIVTATSQADPTKSGTATVTLVPPSVNFTPIRVNAGGQAYTDPQGNVWAADTGFTGGNAFAVNRNIANTNTPALYRTERWHSSSLTYNFPVPNGTYTVTLKFAEIWFSSAAQRSFHIVLNGQTVQMNFDIFTEAGGADRAVDRSYVVQVNNGQIAIQLTRVVENPKISAIQIVEGGTAGVNVSVSPSTATRGPSQTQQFTATVTGTTNGAVTWSINPNVGTISASGLYTAPPTIAAQQTVTVTATSQADPGKIASATVTLTPPAAPAGMFSWQTRAPSPIGRMEAQGVAVNGKLYVFGGFINNGFTQVTTRADVYDAATDSWTQIADVPEALTHSAVVEDGNTIYLIGGYVGGHPGPSSERVWKYNVLQNTWTAGPSLPATRGAGAAARIGRFVYFFGGATRSAGVADDTDQAAAYRLNLNTGTTWAPIADLPNPRNHLGGISVNGKVYAIGGQHDHMEGSGNQSQVDVYDPPTNTWTRVADLPSPRGHIAVVKRNGRILVMGNGPATTAVTLYDPAANVWLPMPPMPQARASAVAGIIGGALIITTGNPGNGIAATTTWRGVFTGRWETGTSMPIPLGEVAAGMIDKFLYVVGEGNAATLTYNLSTGTWNSSSARARPHVGHHHAAEVVNGKLYLLGGLGGGSEGRVQIYDPVTNTWSLGADMPFAAGSSASSYINGEIFVAGGVLGNTSTAQAAAYNPSTNTWRLIAPMPLGLNHAASATDGSKLYVFGGRTGGNVVGNGENTVQIYDPVTNTWTSTLAGGTLAPLPQARGGMGKAVYLGGEFYVIGGETLNGPGATPNGVYKRVDIYNPATNTWRSGTPMPTARHGIFPLTVGGRIYIPGGGTVAGHSSSALLETYNAQ